MHLDELGIDLVCVGCLRFTVGILGVLGQVDDVRGFVLDLYWRENIYIHNLRWLLVASFLCTLVIICKPTSRNCFWNILRLAASAAASSDLIRIMIATDDGASDEKDAYYASIDIQPYKTFSAPTFTSTFSNFASATTASSPSSSLECSSN